MNDEEAPEVEQSIIELNGRRILVETIDNTNKRISVINPDGENFVIDPNNIPVELLPHFLAGMGIIPIAPDGTVPGISTIECTFMDEGATD